MKGGSKKDLKEEIKGQDNLYKKSRTSQIFGMPKPVKNASAAVFKTT